MNVLGFMNRKNDLHPFIFEQSVHTSVVIACFEEFSKTLKKKTVVVMDKASVHTTHVQGVRSLLREFLARPPQRAISRHCFAL